MVQLSFYFDVGLDVYLPIISEAATQKVSTQLHFCINVFPLDVNSFYVTRIKSLTARFSMLPLINFATS